MAFKDRVDNTIEDVNPLLKPTPENQLEMLYIGALASGVVIGLLHMLFLGYITTIEYPAIFNDVGLVMAHAVPPVAFLLITHEMIGHYAVAKVYYEEDYVTYVLPTNIALWNLIAIVGLVGIIALRVLDIFQVPKILALFLGASPGGVLAMSRQPRPENDDEIAIAGPAVNFLTAFFLWVFMGQEIVLPHPTMGLLEAWMVGVVVWGFALAAWNAMPFGPMDGAKSLRSGDVGSIAIQAVIIVGSVAILFGFV